MKQTLVIILITSFFTVNGIAQEKLKLNLGYNVAIPQEKFKSEFIENNSYRGAIGELLYEVNPKFSVGISSGYQSYYQKYDRAVYKLDGNQSISAVLSNAIDIVPLMAKGIYYPAGTAASSKIQPYISVAAGINLVNYTQYVGVFGGSEGASPFAAQGGAGIKIPLNNISNGLSFSVGSTYNYVNYNKNGLSGLNNIGIHAGIMFSIK